MYDMWHARTPAAALSCSPLCPPLRSPAPRARARAPAPQCVVIVCVARALGALLRPLRQPSVVAEMLGGIIIGPTVMGRIPGWSDGLFPAASLVPLGVVANLGLVFFLFLVGLEMDAAKVRADLGASVMISLWGLAVPSAASGAIAAVLAGDADYAMSGTGPVVLWLFLTAVLGISALPVLARILADRRMLTSRIGSLAMSVAAIDDVIAWVVIALMLALALAPDALSVLWALLLIVGMVLLLFCIVRPALAWWTRRHDAGHSAVSPETFFLVIILLLAVAWLAEVIGMSALIGAFLLGLVVPRASDLAHKLTEKFESLTVTFFLPLYFANSGLRTQFGLIDSGTAVGLCILFIVVATVSKLVGIFAPCWWLGVPTRFSLVLGILMTCKGLIALIVVNYGIAYNLISSRLFAILILMVLITTIQTVPLILCVDPPSRAALSAQEVRAWETSSAEAAAARAAKKAATKAAARGTAAGISLVPAPGNAGQSLPSEGSAAGGAAATATAMASSAAGSSSTPRRMPPVADTGLTARSMLRTASLFMFGSGDDSRLPVDADGDEEEAAAAGALARSLALGGGSAGSAAAAHTGDDDHGGSSLPPFRFVLTVREPSMAMALVRLANLLPTTLAGTAFVPAAVVPPAAGFAGGSEPAARVAAALQPYALAPGGSTTLQAAAATLAGAAPVRLMLTWVLEATDMPSAYMNNATTVADIRDPALRAAMRTCRLGAGAELTVVPSQQPLEAAVDEAAARRAALHLCSYRLLKGDVGPHPSSRAELVSLLTLAVAAQRAAACITAVFFDFSEAHSSNALQTLAVAVDAAHPACAAAAANFARLITPEVDVLLVCTGFRGATPATPPAAATTPTKGSARVAFTAIPASSPSETAARQHSAASQSPSRRSASRQTMFELPPADASGTSSSSRQHQGSAADGGSGDDADDVDASSDAPSSTQAPSRLPRGRSRRRSRAATDDDLAAGEDIVEPPGLELAHAPITAFLSPLPALHLPSPPPAAPPGVGRTGVGSADDGGDVAALIASARVRGIAAWPLGRANTWELVPSLPPAGADAADVTLPAALRFCARASAAVPAYAAAAARQAQLIVLGGDLADFAAAPAGSAAAGLVEFLADSMMPCLVSRLPVLVVLAPASHART